MTAPANFDRGHDFAEAMQSLCADLCPADMSDGQRSAMARTLLEVAVDWVQTWNRMNLILSGEQRPPPQGLPGEATVRGFMKWLQDPTEPQWVIVPAYRDDLLAALQALLRAAGKAKT